MTVNPSEGTIKASDIFKLFNNGTDVIYACENQAITPPNNQNLTKEQQMFNDGLELIQSIIESVNQKIATFIESQKEDEEKGENNV